MLLYKARWTRSKHTHAHKEQVLSVYIQYLTLLLNPMGCSYNYNLIHNKYKNKCTFISRTPEGRGREQSTLR